MQAHWRDHTAVLYEAVSYNREILSEAVQYQKNQIHSKIVKKLDLRNIKI